MSLLKSLIIATPEALDGTPCRVRVMVLKHEHLGRQSRFLDFEKLCQPTGQSAMLNGTVTIRHCVVVAVSHFGRVSYRLLQLFDLVN
jgi:hypothetical protein